jgi:hypothetical protein
LPLNTSASGSNVPGRSEFEHLLHGESLEPRPTGHSSSASIASIETSRINEASSREDRDDIGSAADPAVEPRQRVPAAHLAVKHARDEVLGLQLVVADDSSDDPRGGELHLFVDRPGANVQRAAEDTGEGQHIVDLIRVIRTTDGHDRHVVADLLNRLAIAKTTGRAAILRTAALDTAPGPDTPMSTSVPTSKSSAIPHSSVGFARAAIDHRTFSTAIWAVTLRSARVSAGDGSAHTSMSAEATAFTR